MYQLSDDEREFFKEHLSALDTKARIQFVYSEYVLVMEGKILVDEFLDVSLSLVELDPTTFLVVICQ